MAEMIPESQGRIRLIETAAPGAPAQVVIAQDARVRWRLMSFTVDFITDVAIADRGVHLMIMYGPNVVALFPARAVQAASLTRTYCFSPVGQDTIITATDTIAGQIPEWYLLNNEVTIQTDVVDMDVMDYFGISYLMVEEWIEPLV